MTRKADINERITWAAENHQTVLNILYKHHDSEISQFTKLGSESLEHLNTVFDYSIQDIMELSSVQIKR